jgi:iron-sulfur cluster repair protein YtfE (RIC family)
MAHLLLHGWIVQPNEARAQLLREHEHLRALLARLTETRTTAALLELRQAFAAHNASEEALLVPILAENPSVGPARIARMIEEHAAEHTAMRAALAGDDLEVAGRLDELAEDIDAHMAAEERTFLSPQVLRRE